MHTGKSLTIKNNNIKSGIEIVQYDYQRLNSQKWIIRDTGKGGWVISPLMNPSLAINIVGNVANGDKLVLSETLDNYNQMFCLVKHIELKEGRYGTSGLMYKGTGGCELKYYQIGKGNKHLFLNFAIHGFEDSYNNDGQELTYLANEFCNYLKNNMSEDLAEKCTVYILPSLNPDGEYAGWENNGPRTYNFI